MQNKLCAWTLGLYLMVCFTAAHAAFEEILNIQAAPVPGGLSDAQIEQGIIQAGAQRGWVIEPVAAGLLLGTLNIRTHTVRVDIRYTASTYSITYKDSENIKFRNGRIHGAFNKWVRKLNADIQQALKIISL